MKSWTLLYQFPLWWGTAGSYLGTQEVSEFTSNLITWQTVITYSLYQLPFLKNVDHSHFEFIIITLTSIYTHIFPKFNQFHTSFHKPVITSTIVIHLKNSTLYFKTNGAHYLFGAPPFVWLPRVLHVFCVINCPIVNTFVTFLRNPKYYIKNLWMPLKVTVP